MTMCPRKKFFDDASFVQNVCSEMKHKGQRCFFYNFLASCIACAVKTTVVRQAVHSIHARKKRTELHTFEFY